MFYLIYVLIASQSTLWMESHIHTVAPVASFNTLLISVPSSFDSPVTYSLASLMQTERHLQTARTKNADLIRLQFSEVSGAEHLAFTC